MSEKMSKKELFKRYVLFIVSLFIAALGIAITKKGELGIPPVSSVSNILSLKFTAVSFGNWLFIWNCVLIAGQIVIKRKSFEPIQLLQIPLSFLFGYFTDLCSRFMDIFAADSYPLRLLCVIAGTVVLAFGTALSVIANVVMNSGEAFVKDLSDAVHKEFGNVKIFFDICCVVISVLLSLLFFDFKILGIREGTVIAAIFTGLFVKLFTRLTEKPLEKILVR